MTASGTARTRCLASSGHPRLDRATVGERSVEPIVVQHPLEAILVAGSVVEVPIVYVTATLVLALRWANGT